jgi:putative MATE family efflux protein
VPISLKAKIDASFIRSLLTLGIPVAAQSLLESSVNFLDTFMIGQLGDVSIAAVALANQIYFITLLTLFGVSSGVGIFISQYWGRRDAGHIRQVMGIGLMISLIVSSLAAAAALIRPRLLLSIFTEDPRVLDAASEYLVIAALSYPLTAVAVNFATGLRSCGETRLPLIATAISLGTNAALNYLLIFGKLGFPEMGIRGAATGTLIARGLQALLIVSFAYRGRHAAAGPFREFFNWERSLFRRVMKTASPVVLNEIGWSMGISLFNAVFGRISTEVLAARNIADTVFRMLLVVFVGMGISCYIMIGNAIGAGEPGKAREYAANFSWLAPVVGIAAGLVLAALSPFIPRLFRVSPDTLAYARNFLLVSAAMFPFKALSIVQIVGILRAGGDTRFSLILDVGGGVAHRAAAGVLLRPGAVLASGSRLLSREFRGNREELSGDTEDPQREMGQRSYCGKIRKYRVYCPDETASREEARIRRSRSWAERLPQFDRIPFPVFSHRYPRHFPGPGGKRPADRPHLGCRHRSDRGPLVGQNRYPFRPTAAFYWSGEHQHRLFYLRDVHGSPAGR